MQVQKMSSMNIESTPNESTSLIRINAKPRCCTYKRIQSCVRILLGTAGGIVVGSMLGYISLCISGIVQGGDVGWETASKTMAIAMGGSGFIGGGVGYFSGNDFIEFRQR